MCIRDSARGAVGGGGRVGELSVPHSSSNTSGIADALSLYIGLSVEPSVESREISEGVALDYNALPSTVESAAT